MAINAYSVDVPIRESKNTYVPLPFEEMYTVMQEKQKRYDDAEQFERQAKKEITSLTSPIAEHNEYLSALKKNYLDQSMKLHNTIVDKGSAEYSRKLQDIVDGVVADPNYNLIQESNASWSERIKTITKQMAEGKYSAAADQIYQNFRGVNEDGTLKKFVYGGSRAKVDWQKIMSDAAKDVPEEHQVFSFYSNGRQQTKTIRGRNPTKVAYNISSSLTPEAKQDMMWDLQITDEKELDKAIQAKAISLSNPSESIEIKPEMSVLNYQLALKKDARDAEKHEIDKLKALKELSEIEQSNTFIKPVQNVNTPTWDENVPSRINPDGTIASTGVWGFQSASNTMEDDPNIARILKNVKTLRANGISTLSEKEALLRYRNGAKTNIQVHAFTKPSDSDDALDLLIKNQTELTLYDVNGKNAAPLSDKDKIAKLNGITSLDKNARTQGYVSGIVNSFNPFGAKAYQMIIDNQTYIATLPNTNPLAEQEHKIAKAFSTGGFAEVDSYQELDENGMRTGKVFSGKKMVFVDPNNPYKRVVR